MKRYGITQQQFDLLWHQQEGACAICRQPAYTGTGDRELSIDHDHITGKVRGLLCTHCNTALGMLRDNPHVILRALAYSLKNNPFHSIDSIIEGWSKRTTLVLKRMLRHLDMENT